MRLDLTDAIEATGRAMHAHRLATGDFIDGATAWEDLPESWRQEWLDAARAAVEAAAPLIEATVRAKLAKYIEILEHTREEVRDRVLNGLSVDWSSGYDTAVSEAVKIVRGA